MALPLARVGMLALVRDLGLGQHSFRTVESSQGMILWLKEKLWSFAQLKLRELGFSQRRVWFSHNPSF